MWLLLEVANHEINQCYCFCSYNLRMCKWTRQRRNLWAGPLKTEDTSYPEDFCETTCLLRKFEMVYLVLGSKSLRNVLLILIIHLDKCCHSTLVEMDAKCQAQGNICKSCKGIGSGSALLMGMFWIAVYQAWKHAWSWIDLAEICLCKTGT